MVVADGLAPIWRQGIHNHRNGIARLVCIRIEQRNDLPKWSLFCSVRTVPCSSTRDIQQSLVLGNRARMYVGRGQNAHYFAKYIFKRIFINEFPKGRVGFQTVRNLFMTRRVINCHKLYTKPVFLHHFQTVSECFISMVITTLKYDKLTAMMIHN